MVITDARSNIFQPVLLDLIITDDVEALLLLGSDGLLEPLSEVGDDRFKHWI